jgi:hypothetical protein
VKHTYLFFYVCRLIRRGSWDDARIGETRPEECGQNKDEQQTSDDRNSWRDFHCQKWAAANILKEFRKFNQCKSNNMQSRCRAVSLPIFFSWNSNLPQQRVVTSNFNFNSPESKKRDARN